MTPVEEVRAAATRVRCDHVFPLQPPEGSMAAPGDCRKCGVPYENHISLPISDRLREPLANMLDHIADDMSDEQAEEREHHRINGTPYTTVHPTALSHDQGSRHDWTAALTLARAINEVTP